MYLQKFKSTGCDRLCFGHEGHEVPSSFLAAGPLLWLLPFRVFVGQDSCVVAPALRFSFWDEMSFAGFSVRRQVYHALSNSHLSKKKT